MNIINEKAEVLQNIIFSNSPWIENINELKEPEKFRRECFFEVKKEMLVNHNMAVLIKGPRRVGKTEIQKQLIWELIKKEKVNPKKILYLSFDDVQIQSEVPEKQVKIAQDILNAWAKMLGFDTYDKISSEAYCFFDEVQSVKDWDFLIKNRIERNPNVRIILSGSAAHTIFQKSLKTLMGRMISIEISTFSFREFLAKNGLINNALVSKLQIIQKDFESTLSASGLFDALKNLLDQSQYDQAQFRTYISQFLIESGFPQIWKIGRGRESALEQAYFIDENYVKKVTLEDLMLLQQIKKPELYERLLRHLFAYPAQEYNQNGVSKKIGIPEVTLGEAIKLLRQTDLLIFVERFSNKAEPLLRQNFKIYPIDFGLTFAMTKILPNIEADTQKGIITESLVAQTLNRLSGINCMAYLQKQVGGIRKEVDFYLRSDLRDCPIEVKYRNQIDLRDLDFIQDLVNEKNLSGGIVVNIDTWSATEGLFFIPLWAFMLLA